MSGKVYQSEDELREDLKALKVGETLELHPLRFSVPPSRMGGSAYIRKHKRNDFSLNDRSNKHRNRWGTLDEIAADGMYYTWNGNLPPASGGMW